MNENEQNKKGLQLELPQEVAQGEYANFAIITHSSSDMPTLPSSPTRVVTSSSTSPGFSPVCRRRR